MSDVFAQQPVLFYTSLTLIGLIVGSFINVVIVRLPRIMLAQWRSDAAEILEQRTPADNTGTPLGLDKPRSHCPACGTTIPAYHNIPVLSFIWLRGRCAACGRRISWQYPAVETVAALMAIVVGVRFGATPFTGLALVLSWSLLTLAMIDWREQLLPDSITLPLMWLGLLISIGHGAGLAPVGPIQAIAGAAVGYSALWAVFKLFLLATGKEGMGYGDFKLAAAIGAWVGWQQLPMVLLIASLTGALVGGALMASGRLARGRPMPFGPWLAIAGWLVLIAGDTILRNYLALAGLR